jgi:hypothetical protein
MAMREAREPLYFRLGTPGATSISIDGVEHHVNDDGLLEVHDITPNLLREIESHFAGERLGPQAYEAHMRAREESTNQAQADERERADLFKKIDDHTGRRTDRRRSVQQLREQWAEIQEDKEAEKKSAA